MASGTVVEKHASLGEFVRTDQSLFTVADLSALWAWIDVYEGDLSRVHLGGQVNNVGVNVRGRDMGTFVAEGPKCSGLLQRW